MTAKILSEMKRRKDSKYGLITMCIGGGMGAAGILEYVGERQGEVLDSFLADTTIHDAKE